MKIDNTHHLSCTGTVSLTVTNRETGEVVDSRYVSNTVTNEGLKNWVFLMVGGNIRISEISFGDDVGSGSSSSPQQPTKSITSTSQNVLYSSPCNREMQTIKSFSISSVVSGIDFMRDNPDTTADFTSLCARFSNGESFAYRRVEAVTVTRLVDITVNWDFTFEWED